MKEWIAVLPPMKIHKRQIDEIRVIGENVDRNKVLDSLEKGGYTILRLGPRRKKDGWSWDVSQFEIIASKPLTKWKKPGKYENRYYTNNGLENCQ